MDLLNLIGLDIGYIIIVLLGVSIFVLIILIIISVKQSKMKKKYDTFMSGSNALSLEDEIMKRFSEINQMDNDLKSIKTNVKDIDETLSTAYQKVGIIKYDAFKEMGGKLSFVLVLLNKKNNGFLLNSMHSNREGCYTYLKEIINGESFVVMSDEEKTALEEAINTTII